MTKFLNTVGLAALLLAVCLVLNARNVRANEDAVAITGNEQSEALHGAQTLHRWFPWMKSAYASARNEEAGECTERPKEGSSIDEFPADLFSQEQRQSGAIALHFLGAIYFFTVSGMVINYYFIPSVQCICNDLKITPDVGAAVFMATATATPEMFTNVISTFIAESDMGLGTIIGSLMWNILGVAAVSSLANRNPVRMDWVPITRDCVVFGINVAVLVAVAWDEKIYWWEALILLIFAVLYYITMFQSARISRFMKRKFEDQYGCCVPMSTEVEPTAEIRKQSIYSVAPVEAVGPRASVYSMYSQHDDETLQAKARQSITVHNHDFEILESQKRRSTLLRLNSSLGVVDVEARKDSGSPYLRNVLSSASINVPAAVASKGVEAVDAEAEKALEERKRYLAIKKKRLGLWGHPSEDSWARTIFWYYSYPIRVVLTCTMPDPKIHRRWYPYTFIVCVVWIGVITYLLFWMLIIIGHTFDIPESVMGLTVFAIGGCTPEMITGVIMARRGTHGVGVANSIGASSLAILLSLGLPWFLLAVIQEANGKERPYVQLLSNGVEYTLLSLLPMILIVFLVFWVRKFVLSLRTGLVLFIFYLLFITFAVLVEVDVLFKPNYC